MTEFIRGFQASAELGDWSSLGQIVIEWKSTAAAYGDPGLARLLSEPLHDDLGAVPNPDDPE